MTATSVLCASLAETLAEVKRNVRDEPAEVAHRIFLFQLLSVLGQWPQAITQLNVCRDLDPATLAMVHLYRDAIPCEAFRAQLFAGQKSPLIFGEPEPWIARLTEALRLENSGNAVAAQKLRDEAFLDAPTTSGELLLQNTDAPRAFTWIADADTRLGPVLEAIINGKYYWIPWQRIRTVHLESPADLRDLVWMPVHFVWQNGGEAPGLIPTRYVGSERHEDDAIRLSKRTEWTATPTGGYEGQGQRMLATDESEFAILDVRKIVLRASTGSANGDQVVAERAHG
jgi:type VI secretion system protein ImpE